MLIGVLIKFVLSSYVNSVFEYDFSWQEPTNLFKQIQINSAKEVKFRIKAEEYGIQDAHGREGHPRQ